MKRYMWHASYRKANGESSGIECSDPESLVRTGLCCNATAITLYRGKEIKGKIPSLEDVQDVYRRHKLAPARKLKVVDEVRVVNPDVMKAFKAIRGKRRKG